MKIFEIQVRDTIMTKTQHLLDWRQHGFLHKKSCTTEMVHFIDKLAQSINASSRTDVVYFFGLSVMYLKLHTPKGLTELLFF